ncbi:tyrosine-type recombinase/integrase [Leptolyngbya sp. BC1307]|uniref:tyrosine-type recombinase/integrase n=1 Tax=Leptolyngbya sp. BC1307 TaxID=2029589 RepID=UPI000EFD06DD|nr:tyrosine-type recombinase/integrase [Leptolyngbya sp. BC1307]
MPSPTLATVATQFLQRPGLAKGTLKAYESTLMPFLSAYGSWPINLLERCEVVEYLQSLTDLAYTTRRKHQATVQALFNFAVEQGYLKANPIVRLKQPKPNPQQGEHRSDDTIRYLTEPQIKCLYQAVELDTRMTAIVSLLHRSGARISEVLQLDLDNVDFEEQRFQVLGKGNKQRWCFFSPDTSTALAEYIRDGRHPTSTALFTAQQPLSLEVSRISYRRVHQCWDKLIAPCPDLNGTRLHDLRHTFATERVGMMGIEELRALMGHENIQTTLRYQKVTSRRAESVAKQALENLL